MKSDFPFLKGMFILTDGLPIPFLYNPVELPEERTVNYDKKEPIGYSHPIYHYKSGGGNSFDITLRVRNRMKFFGKTVPISVNLYCEALMDLTYPIRKLGVMISAPPIIIFSFGTMIKKVRIEKVNVVKKEFDALLNPVYADINVRMFEVVTKNQDRMNSFKSPAPSMVKFLTEIAGATTSAIG
jgi:hypothetical protein